MCQTAVGTPTDPARNGEGVVGQPRYGQNAAAKIYRGLLQPYAAYLPESYDPPGPTRSSCCCTA